MTIKADLQYADNTVVACAEAMEHLHAIKELLTPSYGGHHRGEEDFSLIKRLHRSHTILRDMTQALQAQEGCVDLSEEKAET